MDSAAILGALRLNEPELKAAGIVHLLLFGSLARGESHAQSDIDLLVEIDRAKHLTLLSLVRIEDRLGDMLGAKVDISLADSLKEAVRERAVREAAKLQSG